MRIHFATGVLRSHVLRATLSAGLLGVAACKGSAGSEGSQGPAGPQGPPGAQGPQGPAGPEGGPPGPQGLSALLLTTPEPAGANCGFGGVKLESGIDRNGDGDLLDDGEVNASATKYLCNGAQGPKGDTGAVGAVGETGPQGPQGDTGATGPTGPQGPKGDTGSQGAQGESGALALAYGDGSAGDFNLPAFSNTRFFTAGNFPAAGANLMFHDVTIDGMLIVSSGTMIRATGDIVIGQGGSIIVSPDFQIQTLNPSQKGIAMSASFNHLGGRGLDRGRTSLVTRADVLGGGSGFRSTTNPDILGGDGGGRLILAARGNIIIRGTVEANAYQGINNSISTINRPGGSPTPVAGGGGGGGGVISLISRGTITVESTGKVLANGGNGAVGWNGATPVAGQMYGGGGGGGGGIIQFLGANTPVIVNPANVQVNGGTAGASAVSGTATTLVQTGGGGGACAGNGGEGTKSILGADASKAGDPGDLITVKAAQPELLFY
ncbi:collagen-like protein [Corallococcus macrosporus]|uniref:Collagen-like protein n=1 Tax=Corallococcus macrosporus TaxID=35 RepID=A0ABS3DPY4_9BACT|nr:collagen-like protein [Corallococcus macrosporus]MBN8233389.1 collagen-like protein [Corallococcus macrosporus]